MRMSNSQANSKTGAEESFWAVADDLSLTFILPTRNRREWVGRALDSCLRIHGPGVRVKILVVDGHSTDGSYEALEHRYRADHRVILTRQSESGGLVSACLAAVQQVHTPFVTFMFDDDILSPYWIEMIHALKRSNGDFAVGFGGVGPVSGTLQFTQAQRVLTFSPMRLLYAYCGCATEFSHRGLPITPVCCLTRTSLLQEWARAVGAFTHGNALREHFVIKRAAGWDLMIYFHSLASTQREIVLVDGIVAQLSAHDESISIASNGADLALSYWLAYVWLCDNLRTTQRHADAGRCAAYVVKQGVRLVLKRLRRGKTEWLLELIMEIWTLLFATVRTDGARFFMARLFRFLLPRRYRFL